MFKKFLLLVAGSLLFFSCKKDETVEAEITQILSHQKIISNGSLITLEKDSVTLTIDSAHGARITSLKYNDTELLYNESDAESAHEYWGSTFWPSPQSLIFLPTLLDIGKYNLQLNEDTATFIGNDKDYKSGISLNKSFYFEKDQNRIGMSVTAKTTGPNAVAGWQITRVKDKGLTFFPTKGDYIKSTGDSIPYKLTDDKMFWLDLRSNDKQLSEGKIFTNGSQGWMAHLIGDILFIKIFDDIEHSEAATDEAEIELYISGSYRYIELEPQGKSIDLAKKSSSTWSLSWKVVRVPSTIDTKSGSSDLVNFVKSQL